MCRFARVDALLYTVKRGERPKSRQTVGEWRRKRSNTCSLPLPPNRISLCTEGALVGMSGASAASEGAATGLRETGRETLGFSGMGGAVFDGLAALEAVHFSEGGTSGGDGNVEVRRIPYAHLR